VNKKVKVLDKEFEISITHEEIQKAIEQVAEKKIVKANEELSNVKFEYKVN